MIFFEIINYYKEEFLRKLLVSNIRSKSHECMKKFSTRLMTIKLLMLYVVVSFLAHLDSHSPTYLRRRDFDKFQDLSSSGLAVTFSPFYIRPVKITYIYCKVCSSYIGLAIRRKCGPLRSHPHDLTSSDAFSIYFALQVS